MRMWTASLALLVTFLVATVSASVRDIQVYAIVERVIFEPNEKAPERIKVYGVFTLLYTNQEPVRRPDGPYAPHKGYLYFKLPKAPRGDSMNSIQVAAKREWADLKSMAGTGQAIMFGSWSSGFLGTTSGSRVNAFVSAHDPEEGLRVYADKESGRPVTYTMDTGIVKLPNEGKYAIVMNQLKEALQR